MIDQLFRRETISIIGGYFTLTNNKKDCSKEKKEIQRLKSKIKSLKDSNKSDKPKIETTKVSKSKVEDTLSELDEWGLKQAYWWDDYSYRVPTKDSFGRVVLEDSINEKEYVDEYFDCDNYADHITSMFARKYGCNSVGTVISPEAEPPHAFNVVVLEVDGEIEARLWEPQNDQFVEVDDSSKYTLRQALIRI